MRSIEKAAVYINEARCREDLEWFDGHENLRYTLSGVAAMLGLEPYLFIDAENMWLPKGHIGEGCQDLLDAVRKKKFGTVITTEVHSFLQPGETEQDLASFFHRYNVRVVLIGHGLAKGPQSPDCNSLEKTKQQIKNRIGRGSAHYRDQVRQGRIL